jgi:hypothetical protein
MTGSAILDLARVIRETGLVHGQEAFSPSSALAMETLGAGRGGKCCPATNPH